MSDCNVCCNPYKGYNKMISCIHCQFECCRNCVKTYIFDSVNDAKCMNCGKLWNRDFLIDSFSYTFVSKDYKKHRENILFDRKKSKMEETQAIIMQRQEYKKYDVEIKDVKNQIYDLRIKLSSLENEKWNSRQNAMNSRTIDSSKVKFYGHCPKDECKGFVSSNWRCGICDQRICKSCKEIIGNGDDALKLHACDPNTLATLRQIKQDCRKCPKCKVSINKISGCNMMWCTNCNISFCWRTGEIFHRNIHNPHYFEWLQRTGNNNNNNDNNDNNDNNNNPCGGDLRIPTDIDNFCVNITKNERIEILELIRIIRHIKHYEMPPLNRGIIDTSDLEYRISYLLGFDNDDKFKIKLQRREKRIDRQRDVYQILDMFVVTIENYTRQYILLNRVNNRVNNRNRVRYDPVISDNVQKFLKIVKDLIIYTNESLMKIKKKYKNKVPYLVRSESNCNNYYETWINVIYEIKSV